jgi:hypothetical protein
MVEEGAILGIELGPYAIGVGLPVVTLLYVGSAVGFVVGLDTPFTVGVTVGLEDGFKVGECMVEEGVILGIELG